MSTSGGSRPDQVEGLEIERFSPNSDAQGVIDSPSDSPRQEQIAIPRQEQIATLEREAVSPSFDTQGVTDSPPNSPRQEHTDALEAELFSLKLGAQVADPSDLTELEFGYGLRPGAFNTYPGMAAPPPPRPWCPISSDTRELVQQYKEKEIDLQTFVYALSGVEWGVCDWGSCQYATILAMFRTLMCLKFADFDPTEILGWGPVTELTKNTIPLDGALDKIANAMVIEIYERGEEGSSDIPDHEEIAAADSLRKCTTLDRAFDLMRKNSWDLWTAIAHTTQLVFKTDFADIEANVDASPGAGPAMNILTQSNNYTIAMGCFLLHEVGYVSDPETAFANFDT